MIEIEKGLELPLPINASGFKKPPNMNSKRWAKEKPEVWKRGYLHCLYSVQSLFETPMHIAIPAMAKRMLEADKPMLVVLRFLGEMQIAGYFILKKRKQKGKKDKFERIILPTKKFIDLKLGLDNMPTSVEVRPSLVGGYIPKKIVIRGGVRTRDNLRTLSVVQDIADENFTVNEFILNLLKKHPPRSEKGRNISEEHMYKRSIKVAEDFKGKVFKFPQFLCSRGRTYVATTCGMSTQGADHEKALVIPVYSEKLTKAGCEALYEAALGYAEQDWTPYQMIAHAREPEGWVEEWQKADKPYCYMACANLMKMYAEDENRPLPAFIPLDGRCSGLQHWSALVRSKAITQHIGMDEIEAPRDIYERVADDWCDSLPEENKHYATRKAAKIPVMTWAYNATQMTSMEHIDKLFGEVKEWDYTSKQFVVVKEGLPRKTTSEMGRAIFNRLKQTLGPLSEAVDWVSKAANLIAKEGVTDIHWITPDGLECKQRKVKGKELVLEVKLSSGQSIKGQIMDFSSQISDSAKHKSAIAPNIIHSLDATHLRMVARELKRLGLPMIFIHDSFASHCNHRAVLYKVIVDTFIRLYSTNYLLELFNYWTTKYNVELEQPPKLGDWEPESLRNLTKFFA